MTKKSFTLKILLILLIFFIPVLLAWCFYHAGWLKQTANRGQLITTPISISSLDLKSQFDKQTLPKKWLLLYIITQDCDQDCAEQLYYMRQVRTALGKDRERVERLIVIPEGMATPLLQPLLHGKYAGTQQWQIKSAVLKNLGQKLPPTQTVFSKGALFIVDPLGNIVLFYAPPFKPRDWLRDLRRLLAVSQIG